MKVFYENGFAEVTMNNLKEIENFFKCYKEQFQFNYPKFHCTAVAPNQLSYQSSHGVISYNIPNANPYNGSLVQNFDNLNLSNLF